MKICNRCLYHEFHPLNIIFDDDGVCSGCIVHLEKDVINWDAKAKELEILLKGYKNKSGNNYDCIVPVTGGQDSYFIVHTVKNVYKMNPLLVTYNKHYNTDVGARNLANLRIQFDCDVLTLTVDPFKVKKITRGTLRRFASIYWHVIAGQTVFPVQTAVRFKIPLIIWGAHQGVDQVGMFSHHDKVEMTRKYRKEHDLMGYEAEDLISDFDEITEQDVVSYVYPSDEEISKVGVRGIYLNNYIRWDSKGQHEQMIELYGYETCNQNRTFDKYNNVDCYNYSDVHDYLKFIKHGYGKITDHVSREIRLNRLSRNDAIKLILKYSSIPIKKLDKFLNWIGMSENGFWYIIDQHRNKKLWKRNDDWEWIPADYDYLKEVKKLESEHTDDTKNVCSFQSTSIGQSTDKKDDYLLILKGR